MNRAGRSRWALAASAVLFVAGAARTVRHTGLWSWNFEDLAVYTRGSGAVLHRADLYADHAGRLSFTYPPFAAVLFVPLHAVGTAAAEALMSAISLGCYLLITVCCGDRLGLARRSTAVLGLACLSLEPVLRTLQLGQVNLLLTALVVADAFLVPPRGRGLLTGVAAGVKLVPGVFVLYYALRRDWPAVARCAVGFGASVAVGVAADPSGSWHYWTTQVFSTTAIGSPTFVDNQSLTGLSGRLLRDGQPPTAVTVLLGLAALALAALAAHRQLSRCAPGGDVAALTCIAFGGLLASPISWTHHWIWFIPAVLVLVQQGRRVAAGVSYAVAYLAPAWFTPHNDGRELHDSWWQQLLCAGFALTAVGFLVLLGRDRPASARAAALLDSPS